MGALYSQLFHSDYICFTTWERNTPKLFTYRVKLDKRGSYQGDMYLIMVLFELFLLRNKYLEFVPILQKKELRFRVISCSQVLALIEIFIHLSALFLVDFNYLIKSLLSSPVGGTV